MTLHKSYFSFENTRGSSLGSLPVLILYESLALSQSPLRKKQFHFVGVDACTKTRSSHSNICSQRKDSSIQNRGKDTGISVSPSAKGEKHDSLEKYYSKDRKALDICCKSVFLTHSSAVFTRKWSSDGKYMKINASKLHGPWTYLTINFWSCEHIECNLLLKARSSTGKGSNPGNFLFPLLLHTDNLKCQEVDIE
ncbi:hypothetical protein MG293_008358 [Ovis ammon polii]|uniref:Uncharacterized protein n=1 Tax=Ovis ammon polii TaxID=230172 RepID=A0AAD4UA26_OVIAM|nr:hypothetical protein MG293_008358 [Ovis ammon polii]